MLNLNPSNMDELVKILTPFMEDESNRRPFLLLALGNNAPVLQRINWSGAVAKFIPDMVDKLVRYGEVTSGKQALCVLLKYVQEQVGEDVQQRIDELLNKLQNIQSTPTLPLSSPAEEKYRKSVERLVSDGEISDTSRRILNDLQKKLDISQSIAERIEEEILKPFKEYQQHLDEFLQFLIKEIHHKLPFSVKTQIELQELQKTWNLKNEGVEKLYIGLANELYKQNRLKESIYIYQEALAVNPNNAIIHKILASLFLQREQIDEAIASYQEAIRLEPNNVKLHQDLGRIFDLQGQFKKAIEAYKQAIKFSTDYASDDLAEIHYLLGRAFCEEKCLEDAIKEYNQAIKIKPQYAEAYAELGNCQYSLGEIADATNNLREAIYIQPDNPEFHFYLGIVLSSQRKYKDAIIEFEKAIEINIINSTPNPIIYTHYAFALLAKNKHKKAETEIERAIKLFQQQNMDDAANQMEHLFERIKKESSWQRFFQCFFQCFFQRFFQI